MSTLPVAFTAQVTAWDLEQAVRTEVGDNFFGHAPRTADLLAVLAIQEVFDRIEAVVGARGTRVECSPIIVLGVFAPQRIAVSRQV